MINIQCQACFIYYFSLIFALIINYSLQIFTACNLAQLNNGQIMPREVSCGASFSSVGTENGFVCYSGTQVGSIAMYYCNKCGYDSAYKSSRELIRICGENGQWNGTIPKCQCTTSKMLKTV